MIDTVGADLRVRPCFSKQSAGTNQRPGPGLDTVIAQVQALTGTHSTLGLERVRRLLACLGRPQEAVRFVHIGGTNGKGSVTAMLEAVLRASGYRVGAFISPHLSGYNERYRLDGRPVEPDELAALLTGVLPCLKTLAAGGEAPTEFEAHTAAALCLFASRGVDLALLEVGLGGRLDATNVVNPEAAVITNVSVDHTAYLGDTIREIAGEKAGIVKPGVPLVTAASGEALEIITAACQHQAAPMVLVGRDVTCNDGDQEGAMPAAETDHCLPPYGPEGVGARIPGQVVSVQGRLARYPDLYIPLWGPHQRVNAACAVAAAEILAERGWDRISPEAVYAGLAETNWPGRFEIIPGRPTVILDGAHNPGGAAVLAAALRLYKPGARFVFVLGILDDKEREPMVGELAPLMKAAVVTRPPGPRAEEWCGVVHILRAQGGATAVAVEERENPLAAVERAKTLAGSDGTVVVAGSLYLVGALRPILKRVIIDQG